VSAVFPGFSPFVLGASPIFSQPRRVQRPAAGDPGHQNAGRKRNAVAAASRIGLSARKHIKLRSCATLFAAVSPPGSVFDLVLEKFFQGVRDERTLRLMGVARLAANRWQSHGQSKIAIALTTRLLSVLISERPRRYRTRQHSLALSPVVSHPDLAPIDSPRSRLTGHYTAGKQVPFPAGIGRCQERKALVRPHATPPGADVWRREPSPTAAIIVESQLWGSRCGSETAGTS
jgi:hypothetical protein